MPEHARGTDPETGEKFVFFWGTASPFSQWHPAPFVLDGIACATAEHWMMASKARIFGDEEALDLVLATADPGNAKRVGRKVRSFDEPVWRDVSADLVYAGNVAKVRAHPPILAALESTAGATLVEASPLDRVWGIGLGANHPDASIRTRWRGQNRLGVVLTALREDLRTGIADARLASALARLRR